MKTPPKPIYLLADSQLLFWHEDGGRFLNSIRWAVDQEPPTAAYVGASNGDDPAFFSLFAAAMEEIGITDCRMIGSALPAGDESFINEAGLILLAGGDVMRGWDAFEGGGLKEVIARRYEEGAVLIGVSAGAVQLGLCAWRGDSTSPDGLVDTFGLVPFVLGAHEERDEWAKLKAAVRLKGAGVRGFGIPAGGGMIYRADRSVEPVRYPLCEFSLSEVRVEYGLLLPAGDEEIVEVPGVQ